MEPYLRPAPPEDQASASCPSGHVAQNAGLWDGQAAEVVFDPRQHDVMFVRGGIAGDLRPELQNVGWAPVERDGSTEMWVRDRAAAAQASLEQAAAGTARNLSR